MGISDFGEMHRLSEVAKPDICVITNIGQCHLENLGSREGILKAKTEIFDFMNEQGSVCINGDDDMLATLDTVKGSKPMKFGMSINNDIYATDVQTQGLFGSTCDIHVNDNIFHVNIPLPGEHMVLNALAATSVGSLLNMTSEEITVGIETVQPVGGRSNILRQEKWTIIDDCYNANPVSMKAAIDLLNLASTNKIAILGDMGELGNTKETLHKEIGTYAANSNIDVLVCVGNLSLNMYDSATQTSIGKHDDLTRQLKRQRILYFETRDELIEALPNIVNNGDTILVKASHSMGFENIVKTLLK